MLNSSLSPDCLLGRSITNIPISYVPTAGFGKVSIGDSLYLYCGNDGWKEQIVTCDQQKETPDCGTTSKQITFAGDTCILIVFLIVTSSLT